jgi:hypothetical protein
MKGMDGKPKGNTALSYRDIQGREKALKSNEARHLLRNLPQDVREKFVMCFLDPACDHLQEVTNYFIEKSAVTMVTKYNPGSAAIFEYLYNRQVPSDIDRYFMKCKGGIATYKRLIALEDNLPRLIKRIHNGHRLLIDNVGSGPGRDMIGVLRRNPDIADMVHIRNIDIDKSALDLGEKIVEELGISDSFSFIAKPFNEVEPREADVILLVGILCPLKIRVCRGILKGLLPYTRKGGSLVYSTAQTRMVEEDPLTDYIMRFTGFHLDYKTDKQAMDLVNGTGWTSVEQFFDEPYRYHCMTLATKN